MRLPYRPVALLALIAAITAGISTAVGAPAAAAPVPFSADRAPGAHAATAGKTSAWVARFAATNRNATATSVAVSPDGTRVYVTGSATDTSATDEHTSYDTVAYNAATGAQLWVARFTHSNVTGFHRPVTGSEPALAVSPDGLTVFVTGWMNIRPGPTTTVMLAYNAATGAQLWLNEPTVTTLSIYTTDPGLAVSPDGSKVFVIAEAGRGANRSYVTIALNATTGAQLWLTSQGFQGNGFNLAARSVAVNPSGTDVFVTGSNGTIALNSGTGVLLWVVNYPVKLRRSGASVAVSPDGATVFVTGTTSIPAPGQAAYWTTAYNASTGASRWSALYKGLGDSQASSMAVSPDGSRVYVTGTTNPTPTPTQVHIATVAYNAVTGATIWADSYKNETPDTGGPSPALAVTPNGTSVIVTGVRALNGSPHEYVTLAYTAATGATRWTARYQPPANGGSDPFAIAVSPDSSTVFVTGPSSEGASGDLDYATVAYRV